MRAGFFCESHDAERQPISNGRWIADQYDARRPGERGEDELAEILVFCQQDSVICAREFDDLVIGMPPDCSATATTSWRASRSARTMEKSQLSSARNRTRRLGNLDCRIEQDVLVGEAVCRKQ